MKVIKELKYTEDHEWIKIEGDIAYIGITDFAQNQLGDIVFVDLPDTEDDLEKEEDFAAIESVKAAADIYMPLDGKILEVNEDLEEDPALLNTKPYENWIIKIEITNKEQLEDLMNNEEYEELIEQEV